MNHKLDTARVFERIFEIYRDQFTLLMPAAFLVFLPVALLSGLLYAGNPGLLELLVLLVVGAIAGVWFQGMVVEAARDILDGRRDHTIGSLFRSVTPVLVPLLIAGVLAGIATGIGFILFIVPGLFLLTIWAVIAPVIVIERAGALDAFGRSRELVRGNGWQVFGVVVVVYLLQVVTSLVLQAVANGISDSFAAYAVSELIVRLLVAPLGALAAAVVYFELTARREVQPAAPEAPPTTGAPPAAPPPPTTGTEGAGPGRPG